MIAQVRAACVERDGDCRLAGMGFGACRGESEWAHLPQWRRSATRGQPATARHTTIGTVMLCASHHAMLDGKQYPRLYVEHGIEGANGPMKWIRMDTIVRERRSA